MENLITLKSEYKSLDSLYNVLKSRSNVACTKTYDIWNVRTDSQGNMEQCIVLKKNNMNAVKLYFTTDTTIQLSHIIPNKTMHAYFGKSVKSHRNILELITGQIKEIVLKGSQQKAFEELEEVVKKATV